MSGQTGVDPETGGTVEGGVEIENRQALQNVGASLEAAGSSVEEVIAATRFVEDMADFATVSAVQEEFVAQPSPARSVVEVSGLSTEFVIELEVIVAVYLAIRGRPTESGQSDARLPGEEGSFDWNTATYLVRQAVYGSGDQPNHA